MIKKALPIAAGVAISGLVQNKFSAYLAKIPVLPTYASAGLIGVLGGLLVAHVVK